MQETVKPWWASKTIIGVGVIFVAKIVDATGLASIDEGSQGQITDLILTGIELTGGVLAVYGRISASTKIGKPQ